MEKQLSCSVSVHEEEMEGKKVFVAECVELDVSDFGNSPDEALSNLKEGLSLLLQEAPEKKKILEKEEPVFVTRVFL